MAQSKLVSHITGPRKKAHTGPAIFRIFDANLDNAEAGQWWPQFVLFLRMSTRTDLRNYIAGETTSFNEQEENKRFLIWGIA